MQLLQCSKRGAVCPARSTETPYFQVGMEKTDSSRSVQEALVNRSLLSLGDPPVRYIWGRNGTIVWEGEKTEVRRESFPDLEQANEQVQKVYISLLFLSSGVWLMLISSILLGVGVGN